MFDGFDMVMLGDIHKRQVLQDFQEEFLEIDEDGWADLDYSPLKKIKNPNLILVLIDSGVASAGEAFISYLRQLENVIFFELK